ncbi:MAG: TonB-dependent receptor, partial [Acidobacteriaceae bacterium]|nr:TonB-dependent receptor [Acidobacteriaceae bacterium]
MRTHSARLFVTVCLLLSFSAFLHGQATTATIEGTTRDATNAILPKTNVTAVNEATGFTRTVVSNDSGSYQIPALPVGDYTVSAEQKGFQKQARKVHLDLGMSGVVDFNLPVGQVSQEVEVKAEAEAVEPTRSMVSSVIAEREIQTLPVNGRQFIDFALLAPGVTIGDTTSGSTDVIIEPVTKLSFAGQNIHYNFVAIDGGDNISTASGIQKTTPSQEAVQEFRVINSSYSTEFGRAVGGIVNVITKSGTNNFHGSVYEYFRNDKLDAKNPLVSPNLATCNTPGDPFSGGCSPLDKLRQNQFGVTVGGPIKKDRTFFFANYEGQRHREAPFYNSVILQHLECSFTIDPRCGSPTETLSINQVKTQVFGLPAENLNVTRDIDYDNGIIKLDHSISNKHSLSARYFVNDQRSTNLSPLNDGFDLPSGFKNNQFRDQSVLGSLTSTLSNSLVNDLRLQYAHRFFNFPTTSTQPHLEVTNTFTVGVNRGNPDFYEEGRVEVVDNVTKIAGRHNISFGGDYNHVNTTESFPLFYPFEADFGNLDSFLGVLGPNNTVAAPNPFVIFFERFGAPTFSETSFNASVYQGTAISQSVRNQAKGEIGHVYSGLYIQDKWRATDKLTLNYGLRWEFERWPSAIINNPMKNFDPRAGISYQIGGKHNFVVRAGAGLFHGIIPSPLLMC